MAASQSSLATPSISVAIQRYFEVALYLLVLTGFGTLASTGGLDMVTVVVVGAALLVRGYLLATRRSFIIPERWTNGLTLGYVAFYLADYFLISGAFLSSTVHLVLFVLVVRLFSARRDRDFYFLAVISFAMVLAAAILTVDSVFLLAFAGFMLMAVGTFILMEMRRASAKATVHSRESSDTLAHRRMAFSLVGAAPLLMALILLGATAIFFILPRISAGYFSAYAPSGELATGFSDRVQLGSIGQIQQSRSVVMHIQIDGDQSGNFDLKWRGVTLSAFDGRTWSNPRTKFPLRPRADGSFALSQPEAAPLPSQAGRSVRPIHYRVLMEPVGASVFFLAATPRLLQGNYRLIAIDGGDGVFDLDPERPVSRYEASSLIPQPKASDLRAAAGAYPREIVSNYLQLPGLDPRIASLAEQLTASADNNYDKAVTIESYLRTKFGYTLQLPRTVPHDPLANFLFERRQGHCEYFASSMAVMLRTLGIPSRVVNGFRTGEFNDLTSQYVVRASNAHSWVEAYFPGYGWVSFDPTPAGLEPARTGWSRAILYLDAMASFWREWVVNYDPGHQRILGEGVTRSGRMIVYELRTWFRRHYEALLDSARQAQDTMSKSPTRWSVSALLATGLLLLLANARRLWNALRRRRLAARPEKAPRLAATIWYERMTRRVARLGWRKSPAQTPAEFVTCIEDDLMRDRVAQFTRHYEHARFGDSAEDASRLPELFEEIASVGRK
ncbi:MAG: transglutaminaseTgpA domain-containing protein [Acidobacteriia bacterium]|nr:transglutaminaseTgpA domain-containing protein [Terriglobia bacterium]